MKTKQKHKINGAFIPLPRSILLHANFHSLSGKALKLLMVLGADYNGRNNGDLHATWETAKKYGFRSKSTLNEAKKELQEKGFIVETRKGGFPNKCALFALTWLPFDSNPKLDMTANGFPLRAWDKNQAG